MSDNKTRPSNASVEEFLAAIDNPVKREDARVLAAMMEEISGEPPVMWGPTIVGFGTYRYAYSSGRTGECNRIGFSPRKANISIYFLDGFDHYERELSQLGKHTIGKACLYVKRLADLDLTVLRSMLEESNRRVAASSMDQ